MNQIQIRPLKDKIIVLPTFEEKTAGGLYIPESAQEQPMRGTVVAVGTGPADYDKNKTAMTVKVGDKIYFGKNSIIEVMHNGKEHYMMKEANVLVIEN